MKRYIVSLICATFSIALFGQGFSGSLVAGISATQVDGDDLFGYEKLGALFGLNVTTPLSPRLDLRLGVEYIGKGSKKDVTLESPESFKYQFDYLEMPFLLEFHFTEPFYSITGIAPAYLLSARIVENGIAYDKSLYAYRKFDVPLVIGMGYRVRPRLDVRARFCYSLTYINEDPPTPRQFNNQLDFSVAWDLQKSE